MSPRMNVGNIEKKLCDVMSDYHFIYIIYTARIGISRRHENKYFIRNVCFEIENCKYPKAGCYCITFKVMIYKCILAFNNSSYVCLRVYVFFVHPGRKRRIEIKIRRWLVIKKYIYYFLGHARTFFFYIHSINCIQNFSSPYP